MYGLSINIIQKRQQRETKVLLFDPENGDTTNKFITALKTNVPVKYGLTLVNSSSPETHMDIPLVLVVRSTTQRFEDDLDAAIAVTKKKVSKHPEIIIYFHMKCQDDCTETAKLAAEKNKYSKITIIDMEFSPENRLAFKLLGYSPLKDVNKRAYERLNEHMRTMANFENKLFVYDAMRTRQSETILEELKKFMHGRLDVEKTEDLNDKAPLAVIYDQQADYVSLLEGVKGSQASDPILGLCTQPDVARKTTEFEEIYIDICDKERYFITFDVGQKLIDFARLSYINNKKYTVKAPKYKKDKSLEDADKDE
ncbi:uncharacterized protein LOC128559266 [Mercenaria mercenaria]|uniref:uncharacterized protein LOC128559266 n=1 Tax=Mercenaria mercenaria TaxID=6596 RepID=UPI00234EA6C7|nr:uncharacterized protein LOC128559266 [Mercenaria mercenaria]